ncbi:MULTISPECIES: hypothetical protein [unclassified Streptomyces]|uniref:hypothetical protein n=1 Tax=unclassified Streptomyces TaxID=2593676 RepID=UPI0006F66A92|nr:MULTISPECIES: hypothetical protein [unclassified Streptomyces]KQX58766.1 hypothetical protein ASD33_00160 [Streptomyces sp. Root1304]KRB00027.1 hypothetical protein ASE09_00160 [Streptomyces sp. Root66D1]
MTVDPTDPDTFAEEEDTVLEQEIPEADAAEQHTDLQQREDEQVTHVERDSANEADSSEQTRVVALDEDDYR